MAMAGSQYHPPAVVPNSSLPWYMYKWLYWVYMYNMFMTITDLINYYLSVPCTCTM
jgi:hypothetical protein